MPIVVTNKIMPAIWMITCYGDEVFNIASSDYDKVIDGEDADAVNKGDNRNWLTLR